MSFLGEIKRRKMFQVAAVYAVVAWLLVQVVATVEAPLNLPEWFDTAIIVVLAIGFPITLIVSWAFNISSQGLVADSGNDAAAHKDSRSIEYALIGLLAIAVGWLLYRDLGNSGSALVDDSSLVASEQSQEPESDLLPNSIAVLPCDNFSTDENDAFFAASLHEELLNQLFKLKSLNVIARTSVLQYAGAAMPITQIAGELKVESVMECSVAYGDGRIVISAQLIDGESGLHLFSERYNREFADVFGIQADIATNIANALQAEFSDEEQLALTQPPTDSITAYALYLKAAEESRGGGILFVSDALENVNRAIELDPEFAQAYALRAYMYLDNFGVQPGTPSGWTQRRLETEAEARASAEMALSLDPTLGGAHMALAQIHESNWRGAEAEAAYARAIELSPNDPAILTQYGPFQAFTGRSESAIAMLQRVRDLEPGWVRAHTLGNAYLLTGDKAAAQDAYLDALEFSNAPFTHLEIARLEAGRGEQATALERVELAEQLMPEQSAPRTIALFAHAYSLAGSPNDAARLVGELEVLAEETYVEPVAWAFAFLALRDRDQALRWIETAGTSWTNNPLNVFYLKHNVFDDPLLEEPEFIVARQALGFESF